MKIWKSLITYIKSKIEFYYKCYCHRSYLNYLGYLGVYENLPCFEATYSKEAEIRSLYDEYVFKYNYYKGDAKYTFYKKGKIHRENGPAIIYYNCYFDYWYDGVKIAGNECDNNKWIKFCKLKAFH